MPVLSHFVCPAKAANWKWKIRTEDKRTVKKDLINSSKFCNIIVRKMLP